MKKRLLIVGPNAQHNRWIAKGIEETEQELPKVANVLYTKKTIIVPSTYLESPWMHKHIISLQQSARKVLFLLPYPSLKKSYPPNFAQAFRLPIVGLAIIEKINQSANVQKIVEKELEEIGCQGQKHILCLDNKVEIKNVLEKIL